MSDGLVDGVQTDGLMLCNMAFGTELGQLGRNNTLYKSGQGSTTPMCEHQQV
jgi:hypothetical protein